MRFFENIVAVEAPLPATMMDFDNNNVDYAGVKNDGMSDQQPKQNQARGDSSGVAAVTGGIGGNGSNGANDSRPGSARSNRHERVILMKEREKSERIKKLEELKEQALAAARLREEQDSKRRKHFEELGRRDEERRRQAEERRRMLEEERRVTLQAKWETKKGSIMNTSMMSASGGKSNKPTYAFGSCTPRLLDNQDGFLWKSQYNLNVTKEPGMRASSAHDLHLQQKEVRLSNSMYEWNQHRTTPDNPLVHNSNKSVEKRSSQRHKNEGMDNPTRVFCGRRKTDLTPTIPIKRDDYSAMSRSTSRGSYSGRGQYRVYSSMTRLDRSRSPGGNLTQYQHGSSNTHSPQRPSRSKSTTHLQSAGLKLTRTEILRQALSKKESSGIRSVDASRPPSSMSSSIMTSSTHSQVQMRTRSYVRKARPASVHVTGVSNDNGIDPNAPGTKDNTPISSRRSDTPQSAKSSVSRKISNELHRRPTTASSQGTATSSKSSGKTSPSPQQSQPIMETSTMKRSIKKKTPSGSNPTKVGESKAKTPEPSAKPKTPEPLCESVKLEAREEAPIPVADLIGGVDVKIENTAGAVVAAPVQVILEQPSPIVKEAKDLVDKVDKVPEVPNLFEIIPSVDEHQEVVEEVPVVNNKLEASNNKNHIENFESIESAFGSDFTYSSKTPEPFAPSPGVDSTSNTVSELLESAGRDSVATNATLEDGVGQQEWGNPFITNITPEPTQEGLLKAEESGEKGVSPVPEEGEDGNMEAQKPKIMTEDEAKARIAEKRREAREAAEKEAARIAEEERLEMERQRQEDEEADRLAGEARRLEEERLRKAIEEEQKRQEEEKKRREEEEIARLEKERQERAAAKEAERIRLEMEERLRREEAERLERKRRVEAIMSRTRKKEAEQQQAKTNNTNSNNASSEMVSQQNDMNGHKENIINQENFMQSSVNSLNNNFNNNNDFSGTNNDLIDNNSTSTSSNNTLISFEGLGNSSPAPPTTGQLIMDNAVDLLNFSQQQNQQQTDGNISPDLLGTTTNSTPTPALVNVGSNSLGASPIINNSQLQEVFIIDLLS